MDFRSYLCGSEYLLFDLLSGSPQKCIFYTRISSHIFYLCGKEYSYVLKLHSTVVCMLFKLCMFLPETFLHVPTSLPAASCPLFAAATQRQATRPYTYPIRPNSTQRNPTQVLYLAVQSQKSTGGPACTRQRCQCCGRCAQTGSNRVCQAGKGSDTRTLPPKL